MEKNNVTTKQKTKRIVILLAAFFLLCGVGLGGAFAWKNWKEQAVVENTKQEETEEKVVNGELVLDEEGMPEDGSDITETKKAGDSETLRKLLKSAGKFAIELTEDVRIEETLTVNGTKKLVGSKSITMELYAEPFQSVVSVAPGATLILDGVTLDGNGIANGVTVEKKAGFTGLSGKIVYPVPYGVTVAGVAKLSGVTIECSMDIGLCAQEGSKIQLTGGKIIDSNQTNIHIQPTAEVAISGNPIIEGSHYSVRNRGTCVMTGGSLRDASGYLVYNSGELTVDYKGQNEDDRLEWYGAKGEAGIRTGVGSTTYIQGLYLHDTKNHGISVVNHNEVEIENCVIENTGKYGFTSYNGKEEAILKNVQILNTKASAVRTNGTSKVSLTDVTIKNTTGFGVKNENTLVVVNNIEIENSENTGIWGNTGSETQVDGAVITKSGKFGVENNSAKMTLKNVTIKDPKRMGYVGKANSVTEITKMTIENAPERGIYNLGGKVTASDVTVLSSGTYGVSTAKSQGQVGLLSIKNLTVTGVAQKDAANCYESVLEITNGKLSNAKRYGAIASKGGKLKLTDVEITGCGERGVTGSGAEVTLKNVKVTNCEKFGVTISKTSEYKGSLTAENLTITGVKGNALNNNGSIMQVTNGKISGIAGNGLYTENGGQTTLSKVELTDCAKRGVYARSAGTKVVLKDTEISDTVSSGVFQEAGTVVEGDTLNIKDSGGYGVFMKGAQFDVTDVIVHNTAENPFNIDEGSTATIRGAKSTITKNEDTPANVAIKVIASTLEIYDGTYNGFTKENGSVIYNSKSNVTIHGGNFKDNVATERGAVLYATGTGAKVTIKGGTFDNNTAESIYGGGAIGCAGNTELIVEGGTFKNNKATAVSVEKTETTEAVTAYGGGAIESNGKVTISGGTFQANTAERGGAIYIDKAGSLAITGGTFGAGAGVADAAAKELGNVASYRGGVLYIADGRTSTETISISNAHFGYNKASNNKGVSSGVMYVGSDSKVNITNTVFNNNIIEYTGQATDNVSYGGVMYINGGEVTLTDCTVSKNSAMRGGAIYAHTGSIVTLNGGLYDNNTATVHAGFIYNNQGTLTIQASEKGVGEFKNHIAGNRGGVILNNGTTTINNGVFTDNKAEGTKGGGVIGGTGGAVLTIKNGTFQRNASTYTTNDSDTKKSAEVHGGGVIESSGRVTIEGGTFQANSAMKGGVIYLDVTGKLKITGGTFGAEAVGNSATYRGGVICVEDERTSTETITINGAQFNYNHVTNSAATSGGVMYVGSKAKVTIGNEKSCEFTNNKAGYTGTSTSTYSYGGVIYINGSTVNVANTKFSNNEAVLGGAFYVNENSGSLTLEACECTDNVGTRNAKDIYGNKGTVGLAGKVTAEIALNNSATITVSKALTAGSEIVIKIVNTSSIAAGKTRTVVTFADAAIMEASKGYFSLHSTHSGKTLSFADNKGVIK